MTPNELPKITSPTLHLYHYVLRNGLNETEDSIQKRYDQFKNKLEGFAVHFTSKSKKNAKHLLHLLPIQNHPLSGSLLNLDPVPDECKTLKDRLSLETGTESTRLAVRRINDTYLLRVTRYISSQYNEQSLATFGQLSKHILNDLPIELGQTTILAGVIPENEYKDKESQIAAECLNHYFGRKIQENNLIPNEFLGSPFYLYSESTTVETYNNIPIKSIHLTAVFLYKDKTTENKANKFYNILQKMLLSYHKIGYFYSQSLALKQILSKQYAQIEQLAKDYGEQNWDKERLKELPKNSLEYYKYLSYLSDQENTVRANLRNYLECIQQIEQHTGSKMPEFFTQFQHEAEFYREQIQTTYGFLEPGLQLYDKLLLSVQTQVSIDDERIQKQQSEQQQKLGQLLTGSCAAIAIGQILAPAITTSLSQNYIDKHHPETPSVLSLWCGAGVTILVSILLGWLVSQLIYRWFTGDDPS